MRNVLPKGDNQPIENQPNLISLFKNLFQSNVNGIRDDKFTYHYYKNVDNDKWEIP